MHFIYLRFEYAGFCVFATSLLLTLLHIFKSIGTVINLSTSKSAKIS